MDAVWERALRDGDLPAVEAGLRAGLDVNARDSYGQTPLMLASLHGHTAVVSVLIAHGADLDVTAKFGLSALMLAVVNGHEETARVLVRAGADPGIRGSGAPGFAGKTAYDLGAARGIGDEILRGLKP